MSKAGQSIYPLLSQRLYLFTPLNQKIADLTAIYISKIFFVEEDFYTY